MLFAADTARAVSSAQHLASIPSQPPLTRAVTAKFADQTEIGRGHHRPPSQIAEPAGDDGVQPAVPAAGRHRNHVL